MNTYFFEFSEDNREKNKQEVEEIEMGKVTVGRRQQVGSGIEGRGGRGMEGIEQN